MLLRVARAVMSNLTFHDLFHMMYVNNFPALAQALDEGADVNMVDGVDSLNLAVN